MQCFVYRSSVKDGLYVYLATKKDLEGLPAAVQKQLGKPELALEMDLTENSKLNIENPVEVIANLQSQGFHLQMPQDIEPLLKSLSTASVASREDHS